MRSGRRTKPPEPVAELRARALASLARLPERYRRIDRHTEYRVRYSKQLEKMLEKVRRRIRDTALK